MSPNPWRWLTRPRHWRRVRTEAGQRLQAKKRLSLDAAEDTPTPALLVRRIHRLDHQYSFD
jgi:hypothetical protein